MRQLLRLIAAGAVAGAVAGGCSRDGDSFERGDREIRPDRVRGPGTPATRVPGVACADSIIGTATIRETAAVAPEGVRRRPQPQDDGWIPTRLADLAVAPGRLAVVDQGGATLAIFAPDFATRVARERPGSGPGEFRSPAAVAIQGTTGAVWVLDDRRRAAIAFSPAGEFLREVPLSASGTGTDLAVAPDGVLYVAHLVASGRVLTPGADSVVIVSRYGPDGTPLAPLLTLHRSAVVPPRFVLPAFTEVRVAVSGPRVAVFYPAGGVIDVFEAGRYRGGAQVCLPPEVEAAYARQRRSTEPRQSWVALVTDVRFEDDGGYATVSPLEDGRGRFLIHRFRPDGSAAGSLAIENPGIAMPGEVRFGTQPDRLVAFSPETGIIASLTIVPR